MLIAHGPLGICPLEIVPLITAMVTVWPWLWLKRRTQ
jgi:hypothetical protein